MSVQTPVLESNHGQQKKGRQKIVAQEVDRQEGRAEVLAEEGRRAQEAVAARRELVDREAGDEPAFLFSASLVSRSAPAFASAGVPG
jgi:hypothetical protein